MIITRKQYNEDIEKAVKNAMDHRNEQQWMDDRMHQMSNEISRLERRIAEMEMRHYSTKENTNCMVDVDLCSKP